MLASIGEFPCVDEAFYIGFCGGSKNKTDLKSITANSKGSTVEERKAVVQKIINAKKHQNKQK